METERTWLRERATAPIDPASLVAFRVLFGLVMFVAVVRFVARGWVHEHFIEPTLFLKYWGFEWVKPWPGAWMYVHFAAMGLAALGIALGAFYRLSAAAFCALFTYAHLIDKTHYLNHYYLVSLVSFLLIFMPFGRAGSIDVLLEPKRRLGAFPAWTLWVIRFQIGVVYVFGGIAKLSHDWLFHAQPLKIWLAANSELPLVGPLFEHEATAFVASWLGAAFDLSIVPLLSWRRSRPFAYAAVVAFHTITGRLFLIGMFPFIMTLSALVFFSPSWPRALSRRLGALVPFDPSLVPPLPSRRRANAMLSAMAAWALVQIAMPLRAHLYPGRTTWTEEGFRFSWRVMLVEKNGVVDFVATEPSTGRRWIVTPEELLTPYQAKMASTQPDMILELSHHVRRLVEARGAKDVEVRAEAYVSLNGRPRQLFVDPTVDLAGEKDGLAPKRWILPLERPDPGM